MNLIAAPTDISSKDLPLRDDVRLLGRILGDTLREQEGEASYQLIENVRRAAVRFRKTQDEMCIRDSCSGECHRSGKQSEYPY